MQSFVASFPLFPFHLCYRLGSILAINSFCSISLCLTSFSVPYLYIFFSFSSFHLLLFYITTFLLLLLFICCVLLLLFLSFLHLIFFLIPSYQLSLSWFSHFPHPTSPSIIPPFSSSSSSSSLSFIFFPSLLNLFFFFFIYYLRLVHHLTLFLLSILVCFLLTV